VWTKSRNLLDSNSLYDSVRGVTNYLSSNTTSAEQVVAQGLTAFTADGFTAGSNTGINGSGYTYAAWCWDAGSSTVTNTQGSISSQVRANASAGFSVVTYTGNGSSGATVGHGLGVDPNLIIIKARSAGYDWIVYHKNVGNNKALILNDTTAALTATHWFNDSGPSSTTFTLGNTVGTNASSVTFVAYCFAPQVGYSSFGSYTGNGSADGPFVYTGFRPRWIMIKSSSAGGGNYNWTIRDAARSASNLVEATLFPNLSNAEITAYGIDILSNGFKLRSTQDEHNGSSVTYIYAAFAESPFAANNRAR
jgi:hypothetical protein